MTTDNQFIQQYQGLVRRIARQYRIPSIPLEDLEQEGFIGLIEAAKRYNSQLNSVFAPYASYWVRKYILDAIRRYGYIIELPQRRQESHVYSERLDKVVAVDNGELLTYEDVLRSDTLMPDEILHFKQAIEEWDDIKKRAKMQKKRTPVGKFLQKYVNK